jgi:hypothetical protein
MGLGPRGSLVRLLGIVLMSVLVVAWAQPATPPATESDAFVVVTTAEQVIGTWRAGNDHIRFDEDGTFRMAVGRDQLEHRPYDISDCRFEDAVMHVLNIATRGIRDPGGGGEEGRYEVRLLEGGSLQIVLIEDPSAGRAGNLAKVYELVERVATSAEQVVGTWHVGTTFLRFDDDGTFRSASSANTLESAPYVINSYRFEDGGMLVGELAVSGVPSCGDAVGRYRVWLLERGQLQIVAIDDPCPGRSDDMTRVYGRAE